MAADLRVSLGQYSDAGAKSSNQDAHGARLPERALCHSKGVAVALADGISSSEVAYIASETAVKSFLEDYFCTSAAWSVKKSGQRVIDATNAWLHGQTDASWARYDKDRGYVCTFTGLVVKSTKAHLFHIGDSRAYYLTEDACEQLTEDHCHWLSGEKRYLARAMGVEDRVEIDYRSVAVEPGNVFVLCTDGVYETLRQDDLTEAVRANESDLDAAACAIAARAWERGSQDNLTVQILRVDEVPQPALRELHERMTELPFPPVLSPRSFIDGYEILRELHVSSRSHVYLAVDGETGTQVALKVPASDLREDAVALERFLAEEWIARRLNSPNVLRPCPSNRPQNYIYVVTEYIEGRTLTQWMWDNSHPTFAEVRAIVDQIGKGVRAFHRQDMIHQDLRPDNVMIDASGTAKVIDFGAVRVAGMSEAVPPENEPILGTQQYSAPEYFLGECGSMSSDIFSLGVITYQMLTGQLPYGPAAAQVRTRAGLNRLRYDPVLQYNRSCPHWIDGPLRKALHPYAHKRYDEVSEFLHDLHYPRPEFMNAARPPLIERNPEAFWRGVSLVLTLIVLGQLFLLAR